MAELKPCPFCGGEAVCYGGSLEDNNRVYIACVNGCVEQRHILNKDEAIEAWNRRKEN